jgi:Cys-rich repeat protein
MRLENLWKSVVLVLGLFAAVFGASAGIAHSTAKAADDDLTQCFIYHPVCADNGRSYLNECLANWVGHQMVYDGRCVRCQADTDCSDGFACMEATCMPYAPAPECYVDSDCGDGNVCIDGLCYSAAQCDVDTDCAQGEVCDYGMCVAAPAAGPCQSDWDCPYDQVCNAGTCVPAACQVDTDCPAGDTCQSGICAAAPAKVKLKGQSRLRRAAR